MIELRSYQKEALEAIHQAAKEGIARQVVHLPTGVGKTVIFSNLVAQMASLGRCLILVHREELVHQTLSKLAMIAPDLAVGVVKAEQNAVDSPVILASVQTLARDSRLQQLPTDWRLLIVDECHHVDVGDNGERNSWAKIIEHVGAQLTVGFTATPYRPDGTSIIGTVFERTVYTKHLLNMVVDGYLVDIVARRVFMEGFSLAKVKTSYGDFSSNDLEEKLLAANAPAQIADAIAEYAYNRRVGVFSPTTVHAEAVTKACNDRGIPATTIIGSTPWGERQAAYNAVREGAMRVLSSCMVLSEGFDLPAIDCVVLARPTRSKVLYAQAIGRGLRLSPDTGKTDCLILDATGASGRHNLMSVAEALGLTKKRIRDGESLLEHLAAEAAERDREQKAPVHDGDVRSRLLNIVRRRELHWVPTPSGKFAMSTGKEMIRIRLQHGDRWIVERREHAAKQYTLLATDLPIAYAFGVAEDTIRAMDLKFSTTSNARWRQGLPTPGQLDTCKRCGIHTQPEWTAGQVSDAITAHFADR